MEQEKSETPPLTQEQLAEMQRKAYEAAYKAMQQRAADQCAAMSGLNPR